MQRIFRVLSAGIGLLWWAGCSELRDDAALPSGPAAKVHSQGWLDPGAGDFHGQAIRGQGWDMSGCQSCHGTDYAGGIAESSCLKCHARTPEGCTTCHGGSGGSAPPQDIRGNTETRFAGVGAHQTHVGEGTLTTALECAECHRPPQGFADPAHIDGDGRAELVWGERAQRGGAAPSYDPQTSTCANTYCHSGGRFGNGLAVTWTAVGSGQAACGTCHGAPPAEETGHPPVGDISCSICHSHVVDENFNIIDKSLHLNGNTDF